MEGASREYPVANQQSSSYWSRLVPKGISRTPQTEPLGILIDPLQTEAISRTNDRSA